MSLLQSEHNPSIYLVGDAILDNYYTLEHRENDLKKELTNLGYTVHNYAVDHLKVTDIFNGITPDNIYTQSRSYSYPIHSNGKMFPLKSIASSMDVNKSFSPMYLDIKPIGSSVRNKTMIVISLGGNDIYSNMKNIIFGPDYFINSVITDEFKSAYKKVIQTSKNISDQVVLLSLYLPYLGNGSSYGLYTPFATPVINKWNTFICQLAKEYNIPVLDLNRTLNTADRSHYGTDDSRISNSTNKCIAHCLSHICSNYNGYRCYYAPNINFNNIITESS